MSLPEERSLTNPDVVVENRRFWSLTNPSLLVFANFFLSSWGDRMWQFAVGLFLVAFTADSSLTLTAWFGFASGAVVMLFGGVVGDWVDRNPRLHVIRVSLALQNLLVALSAAGVCVYLAFADVIADERHRKLLQVLVIVLSVAAELATVAYKVSIEKDWIVVVAGGSRARLANLNAVTRSLDLLCKIFAPLVVSLVMSFVSLMAAALVISLWNIASLFIEYFILHRVFKLVPRLALKITETDENQKQIEPDVSAKKMATKSSPISTNDNEVNQDIVNSSEEKKSTMSENSEKHNLSAINGNNIGPKGGNTVETAGNCKMALEEKSAELQNTEESESIVENEKDFTTEKEAKQITNETTCGKVSASKLDFPMVESAEPKPKADSSNENGCVKAQQNGEAVAVTETTKVSKIMQFLEHFKSFYTGWQTYLRQDVVLSGIALSFLYMTVLGFDSITIGLSRTGIIAFFSEVACLSLCVISLWTPGSPFILYTGSANYTKTSAGLGKFFQGSTTPEISTYFYSNSTSNATTVSPPVVAETTTLSISVVLFITGLVTARVGLWMADLTVTQTYQESVKELERGVVNAVQNSLNRFLDLVKFLLVVLVPQTHTFGYLVMISFLFILSAGFAFLGHVVKMRRLSNGQPSNGQPSNAVVKA